MNILLTILQAILALHTAIGAFWKFSASERTVTPLSAIPHDLWLALTIPELASALVLFIALFSAGMTRYVQVAAAFVAAEMLLFIGVDFASGSAAIGPAIYWLVVALICAFIAYGRAVLDPARRAKLA